MDHRVSVAECGADMWRKLVSAPSILRVAFWSDLLPTVNIEVKRARTESGKILVC